MAATTQHPLNCTWVLWEHKPEEKKTDWTSKMRVVCEFSTVEEFWKVWHNVPRPSELFFDGESRKEINGVQIEALSVFKKGIVPEWEDACNRYGSQIAARRQFSAIVVDAFWNTTVLSLIGEIIDEGDEICGCRIVDKSRKAAITQFKLEIWFRTDSESVANKIRPKLQSLLEEADPEKNRTKNVPEFHFTRRGAPVTAGNHPRGRPAHAT